MTSYSRREFLKRLAAMTAAGVLPASIGRALALPPARASGSLADIEYFVILMQENRSFDHYFGTLRGVRGFGDTRALQLRGGADVWRQPAQDGAVLPFRLDTRSTRAPVMASLDHSWKGAPGQDARAWRDYDVWCRYKTPLTMGYFAREDLLYYHALADAFTICDGYFCSLHGPTNPNRMFLFSGTSGLSVGDERAQAVDNVDDGNWTADMARDRPDYAAMAWTTYAERLQRAGVDWRVYQEYDNYGDNSLAWFASFRGLEPGDELYRRGRAWVAGSNAQNAADSGAEPLVAAFAADVAAGRLPQVSWIVAPYAYSEHPEAPPGYGESLVARVLDALTAHPEVWARTALIINYDENDGFFDHVPPALPALDRRMGYSGVDVRGESYHGEPVGLGVRVPMLVVSPWTRGGWVNSQVFDHTSVIRLLEMRFGVAEPNISPWRRAIAGDLTTAFDFEHPDLSAWSALPDTGDHRARVAAVAQMPPPQPPAQPMLPRQEPGQRPARALPYDLHASVQPDPQGRPVLRLVNAGAAAAVFNVYAPDTDAGPWYYTLAQGESFDDVPHGLPANGPYRLRVHGPNGFLREFIGDLEEETVSAAAAARVESRCEAAQGVLVLRLGNSGRSACTLQLAALDYGTPLPPRLELAPGQWRELRLDLAASDHWYDVEVAVPGSRFRRRLAGHVETGRASRSDPALGREGGARREA